MFLHVCPLPRLLALLCLVTLAWPLCASGSELRLCTDASSPRSRADGTGFEDRIVQEAFHRLGVPVRQVVVSAERAMRNADQGLDDGVYSRVSGLSRLYPNLIMVAEPLSAFDFAAFSTDPSMRIPDWKGLERYDVGIVTGWKIVEANTANVRSLCQTHSEESLLALLDKGRVEVAVLGLDSGREILRRKGYTKISPLSPPLAHRDMHLYLNKRHADLVPKLDAVLRQMRRDGTIRRLTRAGLGEAGQ
ncbi:MAG: transporter substrate-binding domain-containing protein [Proteobacteria bacterium]|nr:transporter substrate-binding domain-containing protein [Pseudomonadota bacterium]